jgi:hypothetical protein
VGERWKALSFVELSEIAEATPLSPPGGGEVAERRKATFGG